MTEDEMVRMEQVGGAGELLNALGLWKEAVGGGAPWATGQRGGILSLCGSYAS